MKNDLFNKNSSLSSADDTISISKYQELKTTKYISKINKLTSAEKQFSKAEVEILKFVSCFDIEKVVDVVLEKNSLKVVDGTNMNNNQTVIVFNKDKKE